jgi:hypothetical protein
MALRCSAQAHPIRRGSEEKASSSTADLWSFLLSP